jgi:hypothetical protein
MPRERVAGGSSPGRQWHPGPGCRDAGDGRAYLGGLVRVLATGEENRLTHLLSSCYRAVDWRGCHPAHVLIGRPADPCHTPSTEKGWLSHGQSFESPTSPQENPKKIPKFVVDENGYLIDVYLIDRGQTSEQPAPNHPDSSRVSEPHHRPLCQCR